MARKTVVGACPRLRNGDENGETDCLWGDGHRSGPRAGRPGCSRCPPVSKVGKEFPMCFFCLFFKSLPTLKQRTFKKPSGRGLMLIQNLETVVGAFTNDLSDPLILRTTYEAELTFVPILQMRGLRPIPVK